MTPTTPDFTWLFLKTLLVLILVLGLAVVFIRYVLPRVSFGRTRRGTEGAILILDRIPLDQRKHLSVVKIVGRYFVLGVSDHAVNLVTELTETEGHQIEKK